MNAKLKRTVLISFTLSLLLLVQITALAAAHQLSGQVANQTGIPLADSLVEVIDPATGLAVASATTGATGAYSLAVEEGIYNVRATPPSGSGLGSSIALGQSVAGDKSLDFILLPAGTVMFSGRVLDPMGNGIPGQGVTLTPWAGGTGTFTTSDAAGNYSLTVAPGEYNLNVAMSMNSPSVIAPYGYHISNISEPFVLQESTVLDLALPFKQVSLHVQDPSGSPVANARIESNTPNNFSLSLAGLRAGGSSEIRDRYTNANGDVIVWLFPTEGANTFSFTAYPPDGTPFAMTTLGDISFSMDRSIVMVFQFAHTPPSTTATITPATNQDGNYPSDVTISLSATAFPGLMVTNTYYIADNGPQQTYSGPFVVAGEGPHTLRYWSIDNAGVYETPVTQSFTIQSARITSSSPLPDGNVGETYATALQATGGVSPYAWSLVDGSLPPGLQLDETTATISGTPASEGTFNFTLQATDSSSPVQVAQKAFQLHVEMIANRPPTILNLAGPEGPVQINAQVAFSASFTDPGELGTHTATWDWGNGATTAGTINESNSSGTVSGANIYAVPGVYEVKVTIQDQGGLEGTATYQYVVVYDPRAGFVTGGGWIDSLAGAYKTDGNLSGQATFGFVSRYQKGASIPTGNTAFEFNLAGMAFASQSYEWLVVNAGGTNAQFKGSGLINGAADPNGQAYKFMLWAGDGASANSADTFRIRIWWEDAAGEHDVYDNGVAQAIGSGNIVVHTKK